MSRLGRRLASAWAALWLVGPVVAQGATPAAPATQLAPIESATDATDARDAFVELLTARDTYFVGESIPLTVRFGLEQRFLRESAIQPFQRRLDVPVQLVLPWREVLPRAAILDPGAADTAQLSSFALDDELGSARPIGPRDVDGRTYEVFEYERAGAATRSGELVVPGPILRYAYATRFAEDFLHGRAALDRRDAFVRGRPLALRIEPLPESGRPREFGGAIGRFSVTAEASPRALDAGESVALVLMIRGAGDLGAFEPPRLSELAGFTLRGTVDARTPEGRSITYDLAPVGAHVREIPPIAFAYFDPSPPGGYRVVRTEPIPLKVSPSEHAADGTIAAGREATEPERRGVFAALALALLVLLVGAGFVLTRRRTAARRARAFVERRRGIARSAFEGAIGKGDLGAALAAFLAVHVDSTPAAVIAPDLGARLVDAGVPDELALRTAAWLDALVGARYGGTLPADALARTHALVEELDRALAASETTPRVRA